MERLTNKAMSKHLENYKLISDQQFAFRAGHSTSDALIYTAKCVSHTLTTAKKPKLCAWTSANLVEFGIQSSWLKSVPLVSVANRLPERSLFAGHSEWQIFQH